MQLQEFIDTNSKKKPNSDIAERWQTRVVPQGLHSQGEAGANQYLNLYGKGIAAPKCIMFAVYAQQNGYSGFAMGMWKKAFMLTTGNLPGVASIGVQPISKVMVIPPSTRSQYFYKGIQPGEIVTMQPEDAMHPRQQYLERDEYWGQAKRDGNKVLIFAAPDGVWYQSRSMKLRGDPSIEMSRVLKAFVQSHDKGIILEGELYFLDYEGKEHRTGAQAAKVNVEAGHGLTPVLTRYMPFYAIYDNRDWREDTYAIRILYGTAIANQLAEMSPLFVVPRTARSYDEKVKLASMQHAEGREGEVWFRASARYHAGKDKSEDVVRTKYLIEMDAIVISLTPTTAQGRLFGAIVITDMEGKQIGSVGTGFDATDMRTIWDAYHSGKRTIIPIITQGFTENGQVMHGRLSEDF